MYEPRKKLHIADALSTAPEVRQFVDDSSQFSDENVNMLVLSTVLVPTSHEKFIAATLQDTTLQELLSYVRNGVEIVFCASQIYFQHMWLRKPTRLLNQWKLFSNTFFLGFLSPSAFSYCQPVFLLVH